MDSGIKNRNVKINIPVGYEPRNRLVYRAIATLFLAGGGIGLWLWRDNINAFQALGAILLLIVHTYFVRAWAEAKRNTITFNRGLGLIEIAKQQGIQSHTLLMLQSFLCGSTGMDPLPGFLKSDSVFKEVFESDPDGFVREFLEEHHLSLEECQKSEDYNEVVQVLGEPFVDAIKKAIANASKDAGGQKGDESNDGTE